MLSAGNTMVTAERPETVVLAYVLAGFVKNHHLPVQRSQMISRDRNALI